MTDQIGMCRENCDNPGTEQAPRGGADRADEIRDRIRGCLIGGAAGDALGYAVEFFGEPLIFSHYGKDGITGYEIDPESGKAIFSDDTQMTLFTAEGLLDAAAQGDGEKKPWHYVADAYQDWLMTQRYSYQQRDAGQTDRNGANRSRLCDVPGLYHQRAPGNTCLSGLYTRSRSADPEDYIASPINNSKGCGGVMRAAPAGLAAFGESPALIGGQIAAITHSDSLGWLPAALLAQIIRRIVFAEGVRADLRQLVRDAEEDVRAAFDGAPGLGYFLTLINHAMLLAMLPGSDLDNIHELGEGWVGDEALAIAI